jgi:hypothetical protein
MALYASKLGNLLEAVNQLGSYVYGTVLGVFVVAFYMKRINGTSVFIGAIVSEAAILYLGLSKTVAYLWLNPIGCFLVMIVAYIMNKTISQKSPVQVPVV